MPELSDRCLLRFLTLLRSVPVPEAMGSYTRAPKCCVWAMEYAGWADARKELPGHSTLLGGTHTGTCFVAPSFRENDY